MVDVEVEPNVQISPCVEPSWVFWEWQFVSLQEVSLRDSGVLDLWLIDMDGVVIQEIVDPTFSCSEVLVWILNNWLNKKGVENKLL